jgi:hypothetical protein
LIISQMLERLYFAAFLPARASGHDDSKRQSTTRSAFVTPHRKRAASCSWPTGPSNCSILCRCGPFAIRFLKAPRPRRRSQGRIKDKIASLRKGFRRCTIRSRAIQPMSIRARRRRRAISWHPRQRLVEQLRRSAHPSSWRPAKLPILARLIARNGVNNFTLGKIAIGDPIPREHQSVAFIV